MSAWKNWIIIDSYINVMKYIDISFPLDNNIAIYPGNPPFCIELVQDIDCGDSSNVSRIMMGSHTGTHIDAPSHFFADGLKIDDLSLERMNGRAKLVDATGINAIDSIFLESVSIEADDIILFKTDNSLRWTCDNIFDEYVTLTYDAADYLSKKGIKLVGIDYLSIETPRIRRMAGKSIHKTLLKNGILICEALRLKNVSAGEYYFHCLPLCIRGADGCPVRACLSEYHND